MEAGLLHQGTPLVSPSIYCRKKLRPSPRVSSSSHLRVKAASSSGRGSADSNRTIQVQRLLKMSAVAAVASGTAISWWRTSHASHAASSGLGVTRRAYQKITETFAREYEEQTGQRLKFRLSFGGSGTQARAVCDGLPGDIVALALPLDIQKIVESGLISADWQKRVPNNGVVAESVVAMVTRKGNPKKIKDWDDLIRPDVNVITANPKTAGVARWNFLALWGHRMQQGEDAAKDFVYKVFDRVLVQPRDAREASDVFYKQGMGDVLLNYENEVILTNESQEGEGALPYVVPQTNVRVETPVAVVDENLRRQSAATREAADAFVNYLWTPAAQQEFADCGFRAVDPGVRAKQKLPKVKNVWTVEDKLGSWANAQQMFFKQDAILDWIQNKVGEARLAERRAGIKR
ncbi:hypothetical protein WJX72_008488 [[Myrmecia] bisecta]|uniref:Sulfate-binding protein n=1 Tax=[Myrmecia] bisecta TaxID=41462 RepID=A0AAW1Q0R7_9CHLO